MCPEAHSGLVVVVEDDDSIRELLCDLLASSGFEVLGCRDGMEGIRAIREFHPSAVTLDLHMPGMDGVEVLANLAQDQTTASVPVVVVSAYASDRGIRGQRQVKAIVQKPFDVWDLCHQVKMAANGKITAA